MRRMLIAVLSGVVMVSSPALGEGARVAPNVQAEIGEFLENEAGSDVRNFADGIFRFGPRVSFVGTNAPIYRAENGVDTGARARPAQAALVSVQAVDSSRSAVGNCPLPSPSIATTRSGDPVSNGAGGGPLGAAVIGDAAQVLTLSPDGTLSANLEGVSLACILQELGRQGEIAVRVNMPEASDAVSREFRDLSLYEGVRRLLRGKSYLMVHADTADSGGSSDFGPLIAIYVVGSGKTGDDAAPAAPKSVPPTSAGADAPPAENDNDPAVRTADLTELAARNMARLVSGVLNSPLTKVPGLDRAALAELDEAEWQALMHALVNGSAEFDHLDGQALVNALANSVASGSSVRDLLDALQRIAEISQEISLAPFKQALEDPNPQISELAQKLLDTLQTQPLVDAVALAIQDQEPTVRAAALRALEEMHEFAPVGLLAAAAMSDPEPQVRFVALGLLAYGDPELAVSSLSEALDDQDPAVREQAAIALDELMAELEQHQTLN